VHIEIFLSSGDVEVERAKDKDAVASTYAGYNRRQLARKRIEAARD
jgi:large subunit ribosomal protein L17e